MAVPVSLLQLVTLKDSRHLWPEKFAGLIAKLEESPRTKAHYGVIADWCDENDEPVLGEAFRWFGGRSGRVDQVGPNEWRRWDFRDLPGSVNIQSFPDACDQTTLAGLFAGLAHKLAAARALVKKQAEELG